MKFNKKEIFLIPNILTYIRFLCIPFFIWSILDKFHFGKYNNIIALFIFLFASITDLVDGKIARKFNMISDIGKVLDPFADKILQVSAALCLVITKDLHIAFLLILFFKEAYLIIAGAILLKKIPNDVEIKANFYGKIAALFNAIGLILSFFHNFEGVNKMYYIDWTFMGIGVLLAILAAVMYTIEILKQIKIAREKSNANINK